MLTTTLMFLTLTIISNCHILEDKSELKFIINLSNAMNVRHLIIIRARFEKHEINSESINFLKDLSQNYIFFKYLTPYKAKEEMIENFELKKYHPRTFVILQENFGFSYLFHKYSRAEKYLPNYIWLAFEDHQNIINNLEHEYIPYDCQFLAIKKINETNFEITEIYHGSINSKRIFKKFFGVWEEKKGLEIDENDFYQRRFNMNGTYIEILDDYPKCVSQTLCVYRRMIEEMGRMINFECNFKSSKELDELWNNNITIMAEIYLDAYLFDAFTYNYYMIAPIWKTPAFLHIRHRSQYEEGYRDPYARPFSPEIWIAIIIWLSITGISILILNYLINKYMKLQNFNIVDNVFISFESFAAQCGSKIPKSISSRIAVLMSRVLPSVLSPLYSAVIISFLTVQIVNIPFTNLEGLINDGTFKIAYENDTAVQWFFKMARDNLTKFAYEKFVLPPDKLPAHQKDWVEQLCKDRKYAFVYFNNDIYRKSVGLQCKVLQIPTPVFVTWDGFFLRHFSPYRKIFNKLLKSFFSAGLLGRMEKLVYGKAPPEKEPQSQEPVKIEQVEQLHKFYFTIHLLCIFIFLLEKYNFYLTNKNKRKKIEEIIKYKQNRRKKRLAYQLIAK